ncbi:MAG: DUF3300 domain-containing protein [Gammaproteobacteria bacterium]|nr:DUF3300 domain-containing protein [Gammaproteobacteria bacterium]
MKSFPKDPRSLSLAIALALTMSVAGCGSKEPPATATTAAPPPAAETTPPPATPASQTPAVEPAASQAPVAMTWTPEALEELLAPVALYPDPVLSQVLMASTNPQEVLDAGNWLLQNQGLTGKALDDAAAKVGFTPPIRALIQFPETVDMMCMELDWTTELGQAFVADQQGVLDAVQRLRRQAMDVGNLKSSPQMKVETEQQAGKEVVVLKPPTNETVYVPQYDPVAVYAPAPATTTAPVPATTTTTTTTQSSGYSTGALVTTGLLAFGAGMLVNEIFDDDDNHHHKYNDDYWYPNYGYGGMPYYPPYPYRPAYGNGYYPANGYNRPPNYQHGFNNNNVVVINNGQGGYWNNRNQRPTPYAGGAARPNSPISAAKPSRPELNDLNKRQPRPMPADVKRPTMAAEPKQWKGQSSYAGANKAAVKPGADRVAANAPQAKPMPKVQGSYGGAGPDRGKVQGTYGAAQKDRPTPQAAKPQVSRDVPSSARPGAGDVQASKKAGGDRGYSKPQQMQKPQERPQPMPRPEAKPAARPAQAPANRGGGGYQAPKTSAMSGGGGGNADRAASQRGKQSMPQGARSKGGGGGGNKNKR